MSNHTHKGFGLKFSRYIFSLGLSEGKYSLFSGLSGAFVEVDKSLSVLKKQLKDPKVNGFDENLMGELRKGMFLVPSSMDELAYLEQRYQWSRHKASFLGVTILPTYSCNLACLYCGQHKRKETMSLETEKAATDYIRRLLTKERRFQGLAITWYGGEPLVAFNRMAHLGSKLRRLCQDLERSYISMLVTNGTLLNDITASKLMKIGIDRIQITVDGPQSVHDKRRPFRKPSKSSFKACMNGIAAVLGKLKINIRVNLDPDNEAYVMELIDELERRGFLGHDGLTITWANTSNFSGLACRELCSNSYSISRFTDVELTLCKELLRRGINIIPYPKLKVYPCVAIDIDSFVLDPSGYLYKCWLDVGYRERSYGRVGRPINFLNEQLLRWILYNPYRIPECRRCRFLPICGGGCAAMSKVTTDRRSEVCNRWRFALSKYLRLFVQSLNQKSRSRSEVGK